MSRNSRTSPFTLSKNSTRIALRPADRPRRRSHLITFRTAIKWTGEMGNCACLKCCTSTFGSTCMSIPLYKVCWNYGGVLELHRGPKHCGLITPPVQTHSIRLAQHICAIDGICCLAPAMLVWDTLLIYAARKGEKPASCTVFFLVAVGLLELPDFTSTSVMV